MLSSIYGADRPGPVLGRKRAWWLLFVGAMKMTEEAEEEAQPAEGEREPADAES